MNTRLLSLIALLCMIGSIWTLSGCDRSKSKSADESADIPPPKPTTVSEERPSDVSGPSADKKAEVAESETAERKPQQAESKQESSEQVPDKIDWITDYEKGLERAQKEDRPVMIDIFGEWCPPCKMLDESTWQDPRVIKLSQKFVCIKIDTAQNRTVPQKYGTQSIPHIVFADAAGNKQMEVVGYRDAGQMLGQMKKALKQ